MGISTYQESSIILLATKLSPYPHTNWPPNQALQLALHLVTFQDPASWSVLTLNRCTTNNNRSTPNRSPPIWYHTCRCRISITSRSSILRGGTGFRTILVLGVRLSNTRMCLCRTVLGHQWQWATCNSRKSNKNVIIWSHRWINSSN